MATANHNQREPLFPEDPIKFSTPLEEQPSESSTDPKTNTVTFGKISNIKHKEVGLNSSNIL